MPDNKQAHLEMIQGVINRLSNNSFLLKGWTVLLVSALFALAAANSRVYFIYLAYFPAVAFWILDGYFLWHERLFRALYDHVRKLKDEEVDFSMDVKFLMGQVQPWSQIARSLTLLMFHGAVLAAIIVVMLIMMCTEHGG